MRKSQQFKNFKLQNNVLFDFHKLACLSPMFREHVLILNNRIVCNFKKQSSLIALTKAIMQNCLNLKWQCPYNNLCPRIPARLNYLLWIHLQIGSIKINKVLDIGTGATLIYPLIGSRVFGWKFVATQICRQSYDHSKELIRCNQLQDQIDLRFLESKSKQKQKQQEQYDDESIIRNVIGFQEDIDVVVCNPPFFQQVLETLTRMKENQHHTSGGEYCFFFNIYRQSFSFNNIKYFSCLIGLFRNFSQIKKFLIEQYQQGYLSLLKFGEIKQGNSTRFIVLWAITRDHLRSQNQRNH